MVGCSDGFLDSARNFGVLHGGVEVLFLPAAPVDLHVVESPLCELEEVLLVVAFASLPWITGAEVGVEGAAAVAPRVRVDAGLEAERVNVADDVGHVAGALAGPDGGPCLGIDDDVAVGIAVAEPPAFVNVDVLIAGLMHAGGDHRFGLGGGDVGVDVVGEAVPRRPAHGRKRNGDGALDCLCAEDGAGAEKYPTECGHD